MGEPVREAAHPAPARAALTLARRVVPPASLAIPPLCSQASAADVGGQRCGGCPTGADGSLGPCARPPSRGARAGVEQQDCKLSASLSALHLWPGICFQRALGRVRVEGTHGGSRSRGAHSLQCQRWAGCLSGRVAWCPAVHCLPGSSPVRLGSRICFGLVWGKHSKGHIRYRC